MDERDRMTSLLSYKRGEPASCAVYHLSMDEWSQWADRLYGGAVTKAQGPKGEGPMLVSAWLSIRAARLGWMDLFREWGMRAEGAGLTKGDLGTPRFEGLYLSLCKEERLHSASTSFKKDYEEVMGYPFRLEAR